MPTQQHTTRRTVARVQDKLHLQPWVNRPAEMKMTSTRYQDLLAAQPAVVMAFSGQPIRQPITIGGPFVMNSKAEITQAIQDYRNGKFGDVPRQARLKHH